MSFILIGVVNLTFRSKALKLTIHIVGSLVASLGFVLLTHFEEESLAGREVLVRTGIVIFPLLVFLQLAIIFIEGERKQQMLQHYEMTLMRKETHAILENLHDGVITKSSEHGLKYFN